MADFFPSNSTFPVFHGDLEGTRCGRGCSHQTAEQCGLPRGSSPALYTWVVSITQTSSDPPISIYCPTSYISLLHKDNAALHPAVTFSCLDLNSTDVQIEDVRSSAFRHKVLLPPEPLCRRQHAVRHLMGTPRLMGRMGTERWGWRGVPTCVTAFGLGPNPRKPRKEKLPPAQQTLAVLCNAVAAVPVDSELDETGKAWMYRGLEKESQGFVSIREKLFVTAGQRETSCEVINGFCMCSG